MRKNNIKYPKLSYRELEQHYSILLVYFLHHVVMEFYYFPSFYSYVLLRSYALLLLPRPPIPKPSLYSYNLLLFLCPTPFICSSPINMSSTIPVPSTIPIPYFIPIPMPSFYSYYLLLFLIPLLFLFPLLFLWPCRIPYYPCSLILRHRCHAPSTAIWTIPEDNTRERGFHPSCVSFLNIFSSAPKGEQSSGVEELVE